MGLSTRRSGLDGFGLGIQSVVLALALNKPFNFSRYVFESFREQLRVTDAKKFATYSRFVMLLLRRLIPNLNSEDMPPFPLSQMTKRIFKQYKLVHPSVIEN